MTRILSVALGFLLIGAANSSTLAQEARDFVGTWEGLGRLNKEQRLTITQEGGRWSVEGVYVANNKVISSFKGKDVKLDGDKGISYDDEFVGNPPKGFTPGRVVLTRGPDKNVIFASFFDGKRGVRSPLQRAADPGAIEIIKGTWEGTLPNDMAATWTFRLENGKWSMVGVVKKGNDVVHRLWGRDTRADKDGIYMQIEFDPPLPNGRKVWIVTSKADDKQLRYNAYTGEEAAPKQGVLARSKPGVEVTLDPKDDPKVKADLAKNNKDNPKNKPVDPVGLEALGAGGVNGLAFTPDGKRLIVSTLGKSVRIMDLADQKIVQTIDAHQAGTMCMALAPDGKTLATGGLDNVVKLWDPENGKLLQTLEGFERRVNAVAFSGDSSLVAGCEEQATNTKQPPGKVKIWQVTDGKPVATVPGEALGVAFSFDNTWLAHSGGRFGKYPNIVFTVAILSAKGKQVGGIPTNIGNLYRVRFSSDSKLLAFSGEKSQVGVFNMATNKMQFVLPTTEKYIQGLAFTPDSKKLVTLAEKGVVRVWDMSTGKEIATSTPHKGQVRELAVSPDGTQLAIGGVGRPHVVVVDLPGAK